jgi:hypothetical protein
LQSKGLVKKDETHLGKRTISMYRPTGKGIEFCNIILDAYEKMFLRDKDIQ